MTKTQSENEEKRTSRYYWSALVFSLALNMFLIGMVVSSLIRPFAPPPPHPGSEFMMERLTENLSKDDAEKMRAIYRDNKDRFEQDRKAVQAAAKNLEAIMSADKFSPEQLDAAMNEMHKSREEMQNGISDLIRRAATELSPEGRKRLAPPREPGGPPPEMRGDRGPWEARGHRPPEMP